MIFHFVQGTVEIRQVDKYRHKYLGAMAEFIYESSIDADDETGDCSDFGYYVRRFGKRLLLNNDSGYVWIEQSDTVAEAAKDFEAHAEIYADFCEAMYGEDVA